MLTKEQQVAVAEITAKNMGVPAAQNVSREDARKLLGLEEMQKNARSQESFVGRIRERFTGAVESSKKTVMSAIEAQKRGEQGTARTTFQSVGSLLMGGADVVYGTLLDAAIPEPVAQMAKDKFTELSNTPAGKSAIDALASGVETVESLAEKNPKLARDLKSLVGFVELIPGTKVVGNVANTGTDIVKNTTKRVFDTTKSVEDRIKNVRNVVGSTRRAAQEATREAAETIAKETGEEIVESAAEKAMRSFTENPTISGALEDIRIMVGLPDSAPSVDLTFRAVKPRVAKGRDLKRVKSQMELANQTIVQNGYSPTSIKEYAEAIYETKKKVWDDIQSKLTSDIAQKTKVDLTPIAVDLLDMADNPALLRTNRKASEQITQIAENLVQYGDEIDVLEAERIKQLINAELDGSFGNFDLSEQAKNAKKRITAYIGEQLDQKLSEIPGDFREAKIKYGSLSSIEDDVLKRAIVFERQNPEGLADMLTKTEAAAEMVFGGVQGRLKGLARLTMQSRLKKANDSDELVKRAFEKLKTSPAVGKTAD